MCFKIRLPFLKSCFLHVAGKALFCRHIRVENGYQKIRIKKRTVLYHNTDIIPLYRIHPAAVCRDNQRCRACPVNAKGNTAVGCRIFPSVICRHHVWVCGFYLIYDFFCFRRQRIICRVRILMWRFVLQFHKKLWHFSAIICAVIINPFLLCGQLDHRLSAKQHDAFCHRIYIIWQVFALMSEVECYVILGTFRKVFEVFSFYGNIKSVANLLFVFQIVCDYLAGICIWGYCKSDFEAFVRRKQFFYDIFSVPVDCCFYCKRIIQIDCRWFQLHI